MENTNEAEAQAKGRAKSSRGTEGKKWRWSKMRDAKIRSDEHLVFRYLVGKLGYAVEDLGKISGVEYPEIKQMYYGRTSLALMRSGLHKIAEHIGATYESLMESAKTWGENQGAENQDQIIRVRSLTGPYEQYGFTENWLEQHTLNPSQLFIVKQETDFLQSEGIRPGDTLLVNRADVLFSVGSIYAATIDGKIWLGIAAKRDGKNCLAIDPSGIKFSIENFDDLAGNRQILGRCVWRSALM